MREVSHWSTIEVTLEVSQITSTDLPNFNWFYDEHTWESQRRKQKISAFVSLIAQTSFTYFNLAWKIQFSINNINYSFSMRYAIGCRDGMHLNDKFAFPIFDRNYCIHISDCDYESAGEVRHWEGCVKLFPNVPKCKLNSAKFKYSLSGDTWQLWRN